MEYRAFGNNGIEVSVIGFGAGHIGGEGDDEVAVEHLLNRVLDLGINLIDTARGYGHSEDRIGRFISHRRRDFILSTKIGYGIEGYADWTAPIIHAGVTAALQRCRTDYLDIVHLHSCPQNVLMQTDLLDALAREVQNGRVRIAAYSGENADLMYAVNSGVFGSIQCSVNIADQRTIDGILPVAHLKGMGVIAKRPVANMAWRFHDRPSGEYAEVYWERLQAMKLDPSPMSWLEMALRFSLSTPGLHSCIIGTGKLSHVQHNVELAGKGALSQEQYASIRQAFKAHDQGWSGQV